MLNIFKYLRSFFKRKVHISAVTIRLSEAKIFTRQYHVLRKAGVKQKDALNIAFKR